MISHMFLDVVHDCYESRSAFQASVFAWGAEFLLNLWAATRATVRFCFPSFDTLLTEAVFAYECFLITSFDDVETDVAVHSLILIFYLWYLISFFDFCSQKSKLINSRGNLYISLDGFKRGSLLLFRIFERQQGQQSDFVSHFSIHCLQKLCRQLSVFFSWLLMTLRQMWHSIVVKVVSNIYIIF